LSDQQSLVASLSMSLSAEAKEFVPRGPSSSNGSAAPAQHYAPPSNMPLPNDNTMVSAHGIL